MQCRFYGTLMSSSVIMQHKRFDERPGGLSSGYYTYVNPVIGQGPFLVTDVR